MSNNRYLLTFFRSHNIGTVAQAECAAFLADATIINYTPPERAKGFLHESWDIPERMKVLQHQYPRLTERFRSKHEVWEFLDDPAKTVFIGSDEILKHDWNEARDTFYHQEFPSVFMVPPWVRADKRYFSACLGHKAESVPIHFRRHFRETLSCASRITVRDSNTQWFLDELCGLQGKVNVLIDPTLLAPRELALPLLSNYCSLTKAHSFHQLITFILRGTRPEEIKDQRPKTRDLIHRFDLNDWNNELIALRIQDYRPILKHLLS